MISLYQRGFTVQQIAKRLQLVPRGVVNRLVKLRAWGYLPDEREGRS